MFVGDDKSPSSDSLPGGVDRTPVFEHGLMWEMDHIKRLPWRTPPVVIDIAPTKLSLRMNSL
jgi:hypothetical protein